MIETNDIEATGHCCCNGCIGMGPCDLGTECPHGCGGMTSDPLGGPCWSCVRDDLDDGIEDDWDEED